MSAPEADADAPVTLGDVTQGMAVEDETTELARRPADADASSIYDSLLRRVAADDSHIQVGAQVGPDGKFVLRQEIGRGGMGRVYRALDRYLLRDVAIKFIFRPEGMAHDDFMALFWQEAHAIARLDQHDNIVRIIDVDRSAYPPFIVMEYLDGQSLETLVRRGPLDVQTILDIMIPVARGLQEAHAKGVLHRDLKPSNIFIQKTGRVKLLDFGLARLRNLPVEGPGVGESIGSTSVPPLAAAGTPAYMAPEQWRGEEADAATDLWAMGVILYRLLAGAPPFAADSMAVLSAQVLSGDPPPPLGMRSPDAPPALCNLVERLLRVDRAERPGDAAELVEVLSSAHDSSVAPARTTASFSSHSSFWTSGSWSPDDATDYLIHESGSDSVLRYWEKVLLILVFDSNSPIGDPHQLPARLLGAAGVDVDVVHCPLVPPGALDDHTASLRGYLDQRFRRSRHIFFLTHGRGTDVVLRLLLDEARRLRSVEDGSIAPDLGSFFYRTRHVALVGARRGIAPVLHGSNPQLRLAENPLVGELAAELRQFAVANFPHPELVAVGIDRDERTPAADVAAPRPASSSVKSLAQLLVKPDMMLARETIAQTFELDCTAKIVSLIAPVAAGGADEVSPIVPGASGATQAEVCERLFALARSQHDRPATALITGDAGVGKSTVLRMLTRRLSREFLASPDGDPVLPIFIPLYFVNLPVDRIKTADAGPPGRVLHDLILGWWCEWVGGITYPGSLGVDWLTSCLRSRPVTLIFDGMDEFITNHPVLSISDLQQMLGFIATEYRHNGWLTIILGVRSTQPGLASLALGNTHELLRLTAAQAVQQFPGASSWLSVATDAPIKKLLLTPLILAQLNTRRPPSLLAPVTHSDVIQLALTTIIERSDLCSRRDDTGEPIDAERWIDALTVIAWFMYRRLRGEVATRTLQFEAAELHDTWAAHLDRTQQRAAGERMLSGIRLLCESRACDALLRRTILYPSSLGEVRFIHREWQDFLAARYLYRVVEYRHVDELRHIGFTSRMCRTAGELLCQARVCIDEALVTALLDKTRATGSRLITANFSALLTNSRVLIEGPAIDVLLSAVRTMPAIARCIALNGFGYRALRDDDASAQDLRYRLIRVFRDYLAASPADDDIGVMRSVAWCYLKAYAQRFGEPMPSTPWPGLGDNAERAVLAMMSSSDAAGPRILPEHRSVQLAFLELQHIVVDDPFRPISGAHYLYCLVVARRHGAGVAELGRELPSLLAADSPYSTMVGNYPLVPELREVLDACRSLSSSYA